MKKMLFFITLFLSLTVLAQESQILLKVESDTANIVLKTDVKDFQMIQLFRKRKDEAPVNIFEFSEPESSFSEPAESGTCYFIKVYRDSDKPFVSESKCVSGTLLTGTVEPMLLLFLLLLICSFFAPGLIDFKFLSLGTGDAKKIAGSIKILAGEDSKRVLLHSSSNWIGDPVNIAVSSFFENSLRDDRENIETTITNNMTFFELGNKKVFKRVPISNGQRPFLTNSLRDAVPRSALFHICENNPESDLDSFKGRKEKRKMLFSSSLSGAVTDLIMKRKALVSIEPFVMDSQLNSDKKPDHSGSYLFLMVIASAIGFGSILKTLGLETLVNNIIMFFMGGS